MARAAEVRIVRQRIELAQDRGVEQMRVDHRKGDITNEADLIAVLALEADGLCSQIESIDGHVCLYCVQKDHVDA